MSGDPSQIEYVNNMTKDAINDAQDVIQAMDKRSANAGILGEYNYLNIYVFRFLVDLIELRVHWAKNIQFRLNHAKESNPSPEDAKLEFEKQINRLNRLINSPTPAE